MGRGSVPARPRVALPRGVFLLLVLLALATLQKRVRATDYEARTTCLWSVRKQARFLSFPRDARLRRLRTDRQDAAAAPVHVRLPLVPAPTPPACAAHVFDPSSQHAFVVPVFSADYVSAAMVLLESARLTCTRAHLVAMPVTSLPNVTDEAFLGMGFAVARVLPVRHPHPESMVARRQRLNYSKLRAWLLTQYAVIVVLDADMVVVRNVDELFSAGGANASSLSAVANYGSMFSAAGHARAARIFNSGLMVIRPSVDMFTRLVESIDRVKSYNGGDQGFLNAMFPEWRELPIAYNLNKMLLTSPADAARLQVSLSDVKVLHLTREKPWKRYKKQIAAIRHAASKMKRRQKRRGWATGKAAPVEIIPEDYEFAYAPWRAVDEATRLRLHGVLRADARLRAYLDGSSDRALVGWVQRSSVLRRQYHRRLCIPGRKDPGCYTVFPFACSGGDTRCVGRPSGAAAERRLRTDADGVTVVTQCSPSKLPRLAALASEWGGPMSAALYVPGGNEALDNAVAQLRTLKLPATVDIHLVQGGRVKGVYPINFLRTLAQRAARTHLVLMLDVDFMVPRWLFPALQAANPSAAPPVREAALARARTEGFTLPLSTSDASAVNLTQFDRVWADASCRHMFMLPAFQLNIRAPCAAGDAPVLGNAAMSAGSHPSRRRANASAPARCVSLPGDKAALLTAIRRGWADVFHATMRRAHRPTDVHRWLHTDSDAYYVKWARYYEPYGIINASLRDVPDYDIRFVDRGVNKVIFTHLVHLRGFRFVVLPAPFVLHAWESRENEIATRRRALPGRTTLYHEIIISELQKRKKARAVAALHGADRHAGGGGNPVCGTGTAAYEEAPELPGYGSARPAKPWEPAKASRRRGVLRRRSNPRLTVTFDAWNSSGDAMVALPEVLSNLIHE